MQMETIAKAIALSLGATAAVGLCCGLKNSEFLSTGKAQPVPQFQMIDADLLPKPMRARTPAPVQPKPQAHPTPAAPAAEQSKPKMSMTVVGSRIIETSESESRQPETTSDAGTLVVPGNCESSSHGQLRGSSVREKQVSSAQRRPGWNYRSDFRQALDSNFFKRPSFVQSMNLQRMLAERYDRSRTGGRVVARLK